MSRPTIRRGDQGSLVVDVQTCLEVEPLDADFGPLTQQAVCSYQIRKAISVDGVVGPQTWALLEDDYVLPPYPPELLTPLDAALVRRITDTAMASPVARYAWRDRGVAPAGYTKGMALAYATLVRKWAIEDSAALLMGQAVWVGDTDTDALAWYADVYADLGMANDEDGLDTLRHLFVLVWGLGMRESSGQHCCGRDQSAANTSATTAEAGSWQQSWNSSSCSTEMQKLLDVYAPNIGAQQCWLEVFEEDVACSSADWSCYGDGVGYQYQDAAKKCPQMAVEMCAVGLRLLRQHWGPINRREAEVNPAVDKLCLAIEDLLLDVVAPNGGDHGADGGDEAETTPVPPVVDVLPPPLPLRDIVISSGHGLLVRGACGPAPWGLDEVDEARRVVEQVAKLLKNGGGRVVQFHDDLSTTQSENLETIVTVHNDNTRDLDVSVHFNAYQTTADPVGVEVIYVTQEALAGQISRAIAQAGGFIDRGAKYRDNLAFLNGTDQPAVLIEVCFVDSAADVACYRERFAAICNAIALTIGGEKPMSRTTGW
jgi:N-acetylmuramoyl-L-alanine amidase